MALYDREPVQATKYAPRHTKPGHATKSEHSGPARVQPFLYSAGNLPVQRVPVNLELLKKKRTDEKTPLSAEDAQHNSMVDDYQGLQGALTNPKLFVPALKSLNKKVEKRVKSAPEKSAADHLSDILLKRETKHGLNKGTVLQDGTKTADGPAHLTTFLQPEDFGQVLKDQYIAQDPGAGDDHGSFSHRIQMYSILHSMTHTQEGKRIKDKKEGGESEEGADKPALQLNNSLSDLLKNVTETQFTPPKEAWPQNKPDSLGKMWDAVFDRTVIQHSSGVSEKRYDGSDGITSPEALMNLHMANQVPNKNKILAPQSQALANTPLGMALGSKKEMADPDVADINLGVQKGVYKALLQDKEGKDKAGAYVKKA